MSPRLFLSLLEKTRTAGGSNGFGAPNHTGVKCLDESLEKCRFCKKSLFLSIREVPIQQQSTRKNRGQISLGFFFDLKRNTDLERQISPEYRSFFRIFSAQIPLPVGQFLDEKGGSARPEKY